MEERLKKILGLVVEDVVHGGEPVGSQHLVDAYKLDVSPATIRNWFAELEAEGYLTQPHTSSGRVPTEKGYRAYVDEIMSAKPLSRRERQDLEAAMKVSTEAERRLKDAAKILAENVGNAAILGLREADTYYTGLSHLFGQPEFRDWNRMVNLGEVLDRLDVVLAGLRRKPFTEPVILLGRDCPFGAMCGSVMLTVGEGSLVGLLGPMRMDYAKAQASLLAVKELFE